MDERVRAALARDQTVDVTTTGRRSGRPRRIETWVWRTGGRLFLTGPPGRRGWLANLAVDPRMTLHLKVSAHADLPAHGRVVTDAGERRDLLMALIDDARRAQLDRWVAGSPLVEIVLDDAQA